MAKTLTGLLVALVLVGCANSSGTPTESPSQASGNPAAWTATPITQDNIDNAVAQLPDIVANAMEKSGVPGVGVGVVQGDKVVFAQGFGVRETGKTETVDTDTVFQIASLSKPVGATVVSRAVSQGTLQWEDPIQKYLPWFKLADPYVSRNVTVADMYAHRSGLPDHAGDLLEDLGYDRNQILRRLDQLPLGLFRVQYAYTNFGLTAGADAAATAADTSWNKLSQDLLYEPLGMTNTSSDYADYLAAPNRAVTHQKQGDTWAPGPPRNPQPQSPAGGVSSTVNDMNKWLTLQLANGSFNGQELIKPDVLQQMRNPHSNSHEGAPVDPVVRPSLYGYGLGTDVDGTGHVRWSHSGAFLLGVGTYAGMVPAADLGIVVLSNGSPVGVPEAIGASFWDIVETGTIQRDWVTDYQKPFSGFYINHSELADKQPPTNPKPAAAKAELTGTYANDYFGPARITGSGAKNLTMTLGPDNEKFDLTHWDGNTFAWEPRGENAVGVSAVTFQPNKGTMTVEYLNEYSLGTFQKG